MSDYPELTFLRALIDNIDSAILSILAHRGQIVNYIIDYKRVHQVAPARSEARQEAIDALLGFASGLELRKAFVQELFEHLFQHGSTFLHTSIPPEVQMFLKSKKNLLGELNRTLKNLDMAFCSLLAERMQLVKQVGEFKKTEQIQPFVKARWEQVLKSKMSLAESLHLDAEAIAEFYHLIHREALRLEK